MVRNSSAASVIDFDSLISLQAKADDQFVAPVALDRGQRTYGGQVLAQALVAAKHTVISGRSVHAAHTLFLHGADPSKPLHLQVDRLRDGRTFNQRQVVASQARVEVARTLISFQVPQPGLDWSAPIAIAAAPPSAQQPYTDYNDFTESAMAPDARPWTGRDRPIEAQYINAPVAAASAPVTEPQLMWLRVAADLGDDPASHAAGLAYLADTGMTATLPLPHGHRWQDDRVTVASLNHAMWFHRLARADDWLYFDRRVESTSAARGTVTGRFYDTKGQLVASCVQEGLIRWTP